MRSRSLEDEDDQQDDQDDQQDRANADVHARLLPDLLA
jgi:hypothetical protein